MAIDQLTLNTKEVVHGSLMIVALGLMLPMGVITAKLMKHRPSWFNTHRSIQVFGVLIAVGSFCIATHNFGVFKGTRPQYVYVHAKMGVATMVMVIMQVLIAAFHPKKGEDGEEPSKVRKCWEYFHKAIGYIALLFAVAVLSIGCKMGGINFQLFYYVGVWGFLICYIIFALIDKRKFVASEAEKVIAEGGGENYGSIA